MSSLKASEICTIIKTAGENRVRSLKLGDLELNFGEFTEEIRLTAPVNPENVLKIEEESRFQEQSALAETENDELLLSDPESYEEKLNRGELEDVEHSG